MNEIPIALVGLGHRSVTWINHFMQIPGYRIVAVCDWIEPLMDKALALIPYAAEVKRFTEYEDLLAWDGCEAIALCVRRLDQGAMAAAALEAGKHVHCEVPAAHTIEDCWRIVLAAERSGKIFHLAEQVRYSGFVTAWKRLADEGKLGRIVYCEGQYLGYYGTKQFFQDFKTGEQFPVEELANHPEAKPTILQTMQPIEYLPHELSPMLKVMDDRVVQVIGMATRCPSYHHPQVNQSDIQVALMKTEKDAILRMACGFTVPVPHGLHHWYHLHGTGGRVEWQRSTDEGGKQWLAEYGNEQPREMDWSFTPEDANEEAAASGHGGTDWHAHKSFRDALIEGKQPDLDVYRAIETAAPAILAAKSINEDSMPQRVPDFRPGPHRKAGEAPKE